MPFSACLVWNMLLTQTYPFTFYFKKSKTYLFFLTRQQTDTQWHAYENSTLDTVYNVLLSTSLNLVKYEIYHFHRGFINLAGVFLSIYFVSNHKNQASKIYALLFCFFFFFNFFCFLSFNPMTLSNF